MKKIFLALFSILISLHVFAGDVAAFVDIGFSEDGKTYLFGEYGKTDKSFQGWAEIYTVDVAKNIFVKNELYKTLPSKSTAGKQGKDIYESLVAKNYSIIKKYNSAPVSADRILYVCADESKKSTEEIVFKDFTSVTGSNSTYHVKIFPTVTGSGKNARSSFYIMLDRKDSNGNILYSKKVGTPSVVRQGVTDYRIEKIFCSKNGKGIVIVVSKTMEDETGVLVRYMVETTVLD